MGIKEITYDIVPEICYSIATQSGLTPEQVFDTYTWCRGNAFPVTYRNNTSIQDSCVGRPLFMSDPDDVNEYGPREHARIMIVTAYPIVEAGNVTPMHSDCIEFLSDQAEEAGINIDTAYLTPLLKHTVPGKEMKNVPMEWKKACAPWLYREVKIVRPDYIFAIGMHVLKFFYGSQAVMDDYYGRLHDYAFHYHDIAHLAKVLVLPAISTKAESRDEIAPRVQAQFRMYEAICSGREIPEPLHRVVDHPAQVGAFVDEAIVNNENIVAIDLEWEGAYPGQPGAKVISFQFSTKPGKAVSVMFTREDLRERIIAELKKLLTPHDNWVPRIGGHFLRADMPWVLSLFKDDPDAQKKILEGYFPAQNPILQRTTGGWDTSLMYHAYKEDAKSYGLKNLAECLLGIPKWDGELEDFKNEYIKSHKLKKSDLSGYGCIPRDILGRYGCWDADATRRLAEVLLNGDATHRPLLDSDPFGNSCWNSFWRAHAATPALLEMEMEGLGIDLDRLIQLSTTFDSVYSTLLSDFRHRIRWDDFNPASSRDKQGFLFGREYTKSVTKAAGETYSMPEDAVSLKLTPIYTTGDKKDWDRIQEEDEDWGAYMPAADAMTLSILSQDNPLVRMLYDICKLGNTLRSNIRPPVYDKEGNISFDAGIYTYVHEDDHKVHTHLRQLLKTGRLSSSAPNLQNISKSAEENIQRILGTTVDGQPTGDYLDILLEPKYLYPMRTIITADPDWYFLESDFTGAELAVMAWISGDTNMIEHVRRNALPEDDPDFYDMHSHIAVSAFRLNCEPTKKGLKSIGKKHLRVAAKSVVFGIPYGRGAKAIQKQCKSLGADLTIEEVQGLIDHYFTLYPATKVFLNNCKNAVLDPGYVKSPWDRYRRFPKNLDEEAIAKYGREACNAPIQSTVADSVNMALWKLYNYRKDHPELQYKICMQIHDALLVACPKDQIEATMKAMQICMVDENPVLINGVERRFSIDTEIYHHWGEPISLEEISNQCEKVSY